MTTTKWTPISTHITKSPQNSVSIQGKPTLIACTGKVTVINPVVTSKGKLPKAVDNKLVQGTLKGNPNEPARGQARTVQTRIPGSGQNGCHNRCQDTEGNHTRTEIHP
ncbi:hypothetical protein O181_096110 [Austropuccinia psidii MF-1]|uniref:Uncharacterized protein n=1 Tax=Austropuccinia psidii MF-1 TaxID=1389203 RepID=A0A9Q3J541_9BASI|nr:hypothetical protein [Austropuccinia psidii MF-1]